MHDNAALSVSIRKRLPGFTLDVAFTASPQETLALLGASGCGKSLTLQCIAGILRPDSGSITLGAQVLFDSEKGINLSPQRRRVGYMFQNYALFPNMTVLQNVAAGVRAPSRDEKIAAAKCWIETVRAGGLENRRPLELSGGERQRVALARMLASEPKAILLDEPFSALDDYLRWQLELELSDTLRKLGLPSVFVSHSRDEVYRLSDKVCVLDRGRGEAARDVRSLFHAPETLSAALISGCKNYSRAEALPSGKIYAPDWGAELTVADKIPDGLRYVGVRAHFVRPAEAEGENVFDCEVERVVDDVFGTVIMLKTAGGDTGYSLLRAEMQKETWNSLNSPEKLRIRLAPRDIMLLR
ncbi:MAG: ATP-binding cassette domain-containing protein [Clostridiales Family XIII bacterium]|jgi:molybdate transport system ATP-binding protein|nr:ATP-binding cassette domain-containing protein [Clostridiales Family XIII bacterium]